MMEAMTDVSIDAPPLAPADQAIDLEHLARMTLGEHTLEREVLTLFDRQAGILLARMRDAVPAAMAAFAHTLKGSARGIGAWRVAEAADAVEATANESPGDPDGSLERLVTAVDEVKVEIAALLQSQPARQL
jgi:HPt (histidine-containing phosphotransfer) domain-containing protein